MIATLPIFCLLSLHDALPISYADIFSLYPSYRLFITDGGYAYVRDFDVPSTDPKSYLNGCRITWKPDGAELLSRSEERRVGKECRDWSWPVEENLNNTDTG